MPWRWVAQVARIQNIWIELVTGRWCCWMVVHLMGWTGVDLWWWPRNRLIAFILANMIRILLMMVILWWWRQMMDSIARWWCIIWRASWWCWWCVCGCLIIKIRIVNTLSYQEQFNINTNRTGWICWCTPIGAAAGALPRWISKQTGSCCWFDWLETRLNGRRQTWCR